MKFKLISLSLIFLFSGLFTSCDKLGIDWFKEKPAEVKKPKKEAKKKKETKRCFPTKIDYISQVSRTIECKFDSSKITSAVAVFTGSGTRISVEYQYNENGMLEKVITDSTGTATIFNYDSAGKLTEANNNSSNPVIFEYNEAGQIIVQKSMSNDAVYMQSEFEYNKNGAPIKLNRKDGSGNLISSVEFEYDTKNNPYIGLSPLINMAEMMYGYPVGNFKHNITKLTTTFHAEQTWQVNGEFKKPGEKDVVTINYEYNEQGYPVAYSSGNDKVSLTYRCDE